MDEGFMTLAYRSLIGLLLMSSAAFAQAKVPLASPPVEQRTLEMRVAGAVVAKVTTADLAKVKPLALQMAGGKSRLCSLKDAVAMFAGAGARVTSVELEGNVKVPLDEKSWNDDGRIAVLWQNRRGLFKLGWIDAKGAPVPGTTELRDVRSLEIVRPATP